MKKERTLPYKSVNWGGRTIGLLLCLFVALTLVAGVTAVTQPVAQINNVQPALLIMAAEQPDAMVTVIVQKTDQAPVEAVVSTLEGTVVKELELINGFVAELPAKAITVLAQTAGVDHISLDAPVVSTQNDVLAMQTLRDEFNAEIYNNSDGSVDWASDWEEFGESTDPDDGFVGIGNDPLCAAGDCLRFGEYAVDSYRVRSVGITRIADLSEAQTAILSFQLARHSTRSSFKVTLSISNDGGVTWTDLSRYSANLIDDEPVLQTFDITPYISENTQIRFLGSGRLREETHSYIFIDDVEIAYTVASPVTLYENVFPQAIGADLLWMASPPVHGKKVTVVVVDSGIAPHADMENENTKDFRIEADVDFVSDISTDLIANSGLFYDSYGHGTHVAGIIAGGNKTGRNYYGIAPKANLIDLRVIGDDGSGSISDVVDALEWIYENKAQYDIRVVNLSLNSTVAESYNDSPLNAALEILWLNDIVIVVSAGNNGGVGSGELYPPANDPFAIVVGAVDDQGTAHISDDTVTNYSAYGITPDGYAKPDLVAPGDNIISMLSSVIAELALQHPENIIPGTETDFYFQMSGTSMASAVVAGAVAQLLEAEPELTPDQVKYRLMYTARTDWPGYDPLMAGAGYLDIYTAVQTPTTEAANQGVVPHQLLAKMAMIAYWASSNGGDSIEWSNVDWASVDWTAVDWETVDWEAVDWEAVAWDEVDWASVNWASVNWASVNWASVNWASVNWASVNWASVNWASVNWASIAQDSGWWDE